MGFNTRNKTPYEELAESSECMNTAFSLLTDSGVSITVAKVEFAASNAQYYKIDLVHTKSYTYLIPISDLANAKEMDRHAIGIYRCIFPESKGKVKPNFSLKNIVPKLKERGFELDEDTLVDFLIATKLATPIEKDVLESEEIPNGR